MMFSLALSVITLSGLAQVKVGDTLPSWSEGYLDIHHINTGKGEAAFFMLPDGTTMLVDAGATALPANGFRGISYIFYKTNPKKG